MKPIASQQMQPACFYPLTGKWWSNLERSEDFVTVQIAFLSPYGEMMIQRKSRMACEIHVMFLSPYGEMMIQPTTYKFAKCLQRVSISLRGNDDPTRVRVGPRRHVCFYPLTGKWWSNDIRYYLEMLFLYGFYPLTGKWWSNPMPLKWLEYLLFWWACGANVKIWLSWSVVFPELLKTSVFMPCGGKLSGIVSKKYKFWVPFVGQRYYIRNELLQRWNVVCKWRVTGALSCCILHLMLSLSERDNWSVYVRIRKHTIIRTC